MKLTNQQIDAVINIAKDNNEKLKKIEKAILFKDKNLIKQSKELYKEYKNISPILKNKYISTADEKSILKALIEKVPSKVKSLDSWKLKQEIIILSIDSKDIKEIYDKLGINI